jgi:hypothetical protein
MRDIVQVSTSVSNPFAGTFAEGNKILPVVPDVILDDGFLDADGYLYNLSDLWSEGELWN